MQKPKETFLAIFLAMLLLGQIAFQVYATAKPMTETMQTKTLIKTSTMSLTATSWADEFTFEDPTDHKKEVSVMRNITVTRTDYLDPRDQIWYNEIRCSGYIVVDGGEPFPIDFHTAKYPLDKLFHAIETTSESTSYTATTTLPTYPWDGVTFVKNSQPFHIEYEHPHNVPGYNPTYPAIVPNEGVSSTIQGTDRWHNHIPTWIIQDMIEYSTLSSWAGAIVALILILLAIPELFITKVTAAVLAIIPAVIAVLGLTIRVFAETVLKTELSDGWNWVWGQGSFWIFAWWWMSFGKLRDWGTFWIFPVFGSPEQNPQNGGHGTWGGGGSMMRPGFAAPL